MATRQLESSSTDLDQLHPRPTAEFIHECRVKKGTPYVDADYLMKKGEKQAEPDTAPSHPFDVERQKRKPNTAPSAAAVATETGTD